MFFEEVVALERLNAGFAEAFGEVRLSTRLRNPRRQMMVWHLLNTSLCSNCFRGEDLIRWVPNGFQTASAAETLALRRQSVLAWGIAAGCGGIPQPMSGNIGGRARADGRACLRADFPSQTDGRDPGSKAKRVGRPLAQKG